MRRKFAIRLDRKYWQCVADCDTTVNARTAGIVAWLRENDQRHKRNWEADIANATECIRWHFEQRMDVIRAQFAKLGVVAE